MTGVGRRRKPTAYRIEELRHQVDAVVARVEATPVHVAPRHPPRPFGLGCTGGGRTEGVAAARLPSGLTDVQVFRIEWPAWSLVEATEQQPGEGPTDDLIASAMTAARMAEPYPELLAAGSHLLAVGSPHRRRRLTSAVEDKPGKGSEEDVSGSSAGPEWFV